MVVDLVGGSRDLVRTLAPGGLFVSVLTPPPTTWPPRWSGARRFTRFLVEPDHEGLFALSQLVEDGDLRVDVSATFPLEDAAKAHAQGETGRTTGKIVLTV